MKIKTLLIASIIFTGCTTTKKINCCDTESHQCDELYPSDYNCDIQPRTLTTTANPWGYAPVHGIYGNSAYNPYRSYYPNTQTVYYVPHNTDFYGNQLQPNEYRSRDINGRPTVGDVTRPQAPPVSKPRPNITRNIKEN
jgi:hypothetical protein